MGKDQKRNKLGQYQSMPKARKVTPDAPLKPKHVKTTAVAEKPGNRTAKSFSLPRGHMADGVGTLHEYMDRVRWVYVYFLQRIG